MWLLGDLLFLSPAELFFAFSWLSYNYPNSIFRQLYMKVGSIFGFLALLVIFAFIWKDLQHFIPGGIPTNTTDGIYAQITNYDTNYELSSNKRYYDNWRGTSGYDMSLHIQNNTSKELKSIEIDIMEFECKDKPDHIYGIKDLDNCVWNNRHEEVEYGESILPHSYADITFKTQMDPNNMSFGKYPYVYYQSRVNGYTVVHSYDKTNKYDPTTPEYLK